MKTLFLVAAIALAAGQAAADPVAEAGASVVVRYADLDLADPAQAAVMLKRVRRAAAGACYASPWNAGTDIDSIERFDACYRTTVRDAVRRLNAPQVSMRFDSRPDSRRLARVP
jgi:UrcA family protein